MDAMNGDLFAIPLFSVVFHGYGYFHKFFVPDGKIGIKTKVSLLLGAALLILTPYLFKDIFRDRLMSFSVISITSL